MVLYHSSVVLFFFSLLSLLCNYNLEYSFLPFFLILEVTRTSCHECISRLWMALNNPDWPHLGPPPSPPFCLRAQDMPEHCCSYSLIISSSSWVDSSYTYCGWSAALALALIPRWAWSPFRTLSTVKSLFLPPDWGLIEPWTWFIALSHLGPALLAAFRLWIPAQPDLSSQLACLEGAVLLLLAVGLQRARCSAWLLVMPCFC